MAALLASAASRSGDPAKGVLARCSAPEHRLPQGGAQRRNLLLAAAAGVAGLTAALKLAGGDASPPQRAGKQANPYALAAAEFAEAEASSAAPPDLRVLPASGKACLALRTAPACLRLVSPAIAVGCSPGRSGRSAAAGTSFLPPSVSSMLPVCKGDAGSSTHCILTCLLTVVSKQAVLGSNRGAERMAGLGLPDAGPRDAQLTVKGTSGNRYLVYRSSERRDALFLENREGALYLLDVTGSVRARALAVGGLLEQRLRLICITTAFMQAESACHAAAVDAPPDPVAACSHVQRRSATWVLWEDLGLIKIRDIACLNMIMSSVSLA